MNNTNQNSDDGINTIVEALRSAETVPQMAQLVAELLHTCGIYGLQQIGQEMSRIAVTSGLGRN